jgi:hypothetical protein
LCLIFLSESESTLVRHCMVLPQPTFRSFSHLGTTFHSHSSKSCHTFIFSFISHSSHSSIHQLHSLSNKICWDCILRLLVPSVGTQNLKTRSFFEIFLQGVMVVLLTKG